MQQYQFEKIYSQMEKEYGKIAKGDEDFHTINIFAMESNIKSRCTGETFELDSFRNEDNARLEHALLMAFDPFTNEELHAAISADSNIDLTDKKTLHDIYAEPVICLLRIKESVNTWIKRMGSDGYFDFAESFMGKNITGDEMTYAWSDITDQ